MDGDAVCAHLASFLFYFILFIYLAAPGLGCGMQDLPSSLRCVGSACKPLVVACGV